MCCLAGVFFFFFNDTATTEIYTLSLHDALPISHARQHQQLRRQQCAAAKQHLAPAVQLLHRSEEHTSELQSRLHLVCRLLLEKKKQRTIGRPPTSSGMNETIHHAYLTSLMFARA